MQITHIQDDKISGMFSAENERDEQVGYLVWDFPEENLNTIRICELLIHKKENRKNGIESLLIKTLLKHARKLKVNEVVGTAQAHDKDSHALFKKHGFYFPEPETFMLRLGLNS